MKKYIFSGYEIQEGNSYFVLDSIEPEIPERTKISIYETPFSLVRFKRRNCIGRFDLTTFESFCCPNQKNLVEDVSNNTCVECFKFNSFNPSFYNVKLSDLSQKQMDYNLSPHNVYLVLFSENHIKVGISHHKRTHTRWLEQGARIATTIYECENAYDAREIEEKISRNLKLSESYRSDLKRLLVKEQLNIDACISKIEMIKTKIEDFIKVKTINSEYNNLDKYYLRSKSINRNIIDVSSDSPLMISGLGVGLIGDVLIFENSNQQFLVSLKKFLSYQVTFEAVLNKQNFTPLQTSLF